MTVRQKLYQVIFETNTRAGRLFDVYLLWVIVASVAIVMTESVPDIGRSYAKFFILLEWTFTIIFTLEYIARVWISPKPFSYIFSLWGIIDLLSILPTYLSFIFAGYHYLLIVRIFRLLRVFRILKLARFNHEAQSLMAAMRSSMYKISIFLFAVLAIVTFLGTIMYVVEGGEEGFVSIPQSIYWAIVTVTTVGYGDMVPHTVVGKFISSFAMILGYAIIAVPTGIVTVEMSKPFAKNKKCTKCSHNNESAARFCINCGTAMADEKQP